MSTIPISLLLSACSDYGQAPVEGGDQFDVPEQASVDVLLVVDNSSSMEPYQAMLASGFEGFITPFLDGLIDYHIAITTTDDGIEGRGDELTAGAFVAPVITAAMDLAEAESLFVAGVSAGSQGSGVEVGLRTAVLALMDEEHLGEQISAFLREDASLSVIFISDEEDQSPLPVSDYLNLFWGVKGRRHWEDFSASALTVTDASACAPGTADFSTPGTRYIDLALQTAGVTGNVCTDDFGEIVEALALANTRGVYSYLLTEEPLAYSLEVSVEEAGTETTLPCADGEWAYQRVAQGTRPAIVFRPESPPPSGSVLRVRYKLGDGSVDRFCEEVP